MANEALHEMMAKLTEEAAVIHAELQPYREELHKLLVEMEPFNQKEQALRDKIKELKEPLIAIDNQRSALSLALSIAEPGKHHRVKFVQMNVSKLSEAPPEVQAVYAAAKAR